MPVLEISATVPQVDDDDDAGDDRPMPLLEVSVPSDESGDRDPYADLVDPYADDTVVDMHTNHDEARAAAKTGVFVPARTIAENVFTEECGEDDVVRSRVNLLKTAVNNARSRLRPKEPDTLDLEVDADFINSDEFLEKDIQFHARRHFVFATAYQLDILRQAKRWFVDGTFKVS
ncbi:uncharacterized protein LOC127843607 [Dreissena polymorpha]|nr:uncharacterized protein LOC127843607 [Dreissena polymorpha]